MSAAYWALGRGTGVVALVLFTVALVLGIVARSGRPVPWLGRFGTSDLHRTAALTGTGLVVAHVATLSLDPYAQLRLVDVVLPFLGAYRPFWLGLGTLALDLLVVVTVVSLLRHRVGPRVFKAVHWATYALWPVALLHALGNGTDGGTAWFRWLAVACTGAVLTAVAWRLAPSYDGRGWTRHRRRTA
jgi:predicted ferric reductase